MKKGSLVKSDRIVGFTTNLKGGDDMPKARRMNWRARAASMLVLAAAIGGFTAARAEAANPPIPPAWSQILPADKRFVLVMGGAAVLDEETGLVWEQSPDTATVDWLGALSSCNDRTVGGRKGWRLPTIQELTSLVDPTIAFPGPTLLSGHPFSNVPLTGSWSATSNASIATAAWLVFRSEEHTSELQSQR